ncbi:MAG: glycosyltransferase family 39 protein [Microcystis sp. LE17-20A]|uniref:ArnT family glycosyltransferase n=1 Tax=unclassified Microcystis TaxID=2643300 RepID=UPI0022C707F5|nr:MULTISPECIES: glycosyltransferase family 39 protein [unclassified Microcystis]MCZ8039097.1 glycosyltransferase family 39 protein [Microcystis sp. LE17-20A]MCZ8211270.1 glycosyltransferase family 39 protein [Microcystis sp. LE19-8.1F]
MNKTNVISWSYFSHPKKADIVNILIIIAIWTVMVIVVNPLGNFPLNDDWVYGLAVKSILEKGDFSFPSPAHANLFFQAFWGALFCLPFGFSFTALRFSTLTLGLIGAIGTYGLLREVNANQKISLLGALLVVVNPLYFGLANSFMTDVPFLALSILSFYFLIRGLKRESISEVILGLCLVYVNILIRQYAIVILLSFALAYSFKKRFKIKFLFASFVIFSSGILLHRFYQNWLYSTGRTPAIAENVLSRKIYFRYDILMISLIYIGCFIFPIIAIFFVKKLKEISRQQKTITILIMSSFFVVVMGRLIWQGKTMPFIGNVLRYFGLGPLTLRDTFLLKVNLPSYSLGLKVFWLIITAMGVLGAVLLLYYLCLAIIQTFSESEKWLKVLILSAILIYLFLFGVKYPFDRYFLFLLPLFMVLLVISNNYINEQYIGKKITAFALTMTFIWGGFTMAATHDYLAWNRTRWQALNDLMEQGVTPEYIDGGYEFNGWYLNDIKYQKQRGKSYWWVNRDDYMISSGLLEGYQEVKRYPFTRWLLLKQDNVFVLHKIAEDKTNGT